MAFNPSGTNYASMLQQRQRADEGLTRALDAQGRAEKQKRIKKSGERSFLEKGLSAVARGAAAYYTGGMSEQMGMGGAIDSAMLGTDSEGRAVRNELGDLVGTGAAVYAGSKAMKAGKLGAQDARFDKLMDRRQQNVKTLFDAGMKKEGMKAQAEMEDMRLKYDANRKEAEGKGWGGSGLGMSDKDYDLIPVKHTPESRAAKVNLLNEGGDPSQYAYKGTDMGDDQRRHGTGSTSSMMPPKADAVQDSGRHPSKESQRMQFGPELGADTASKSFARTHEKTGTPTIMDQKQSEKEDLINRIKGDPGRSDADVQQSRAVNSWMRTPLTLDPNEEGRSIKVTGKWGDKWRQRNAIPKGVG